MAAGSFPSFKDYSKGASLTTFPNGFPGAEEYCLSVLRDALGEGRRLGVCLRDLELRFWVDSCSLHTIHSTHILADLHTYKLTYIHKYTRT